MHYHFSLLDKHWYECIMCLLRQGIAQSVLRFVCGLDDSAFNSQQKHHIYLLFQSIQAVSGAHIASCLVGIESSSLTVR